MRAECGVSVVRAAILADQDTATAGAKLATGGRSDFCRRANAHELHERLRRERLAVYRGAIDRVAAEGQRPNFSGNPRSGLIGVMTGAGFA